MSATPIVLSIPSRSIDGVAYSVEVTATAETCTCTGFTMRRSCAHAKVARRIADDPTATALALLATVAALRISAKAPKR